MFKVHAKGMTCNPIKFQECLQSTYNTTYEALIMHNTVWAKCHVSNSLMPPLIFDNVHGHQVKLTKLIVIRLSIMLEVIYKQNPRL